MGYQDVIVEGAGLSNLGGNQVIYEDGNGMMQPVTPLLTKTVLSEFEFAEACKEEKNKLARRIMIFILLSAVGAALMFGIFYPVMKDTGNNLTLESLKPTS